MTKLTQVLGKDIYQEVRDKDVIDFGCGEGNETIELAQYARRVIGLDVRESVFSEAKNIGPANVTFTTSTREKADIILSIDAFEHFDDPAAIMVKMRSLLKPGGYIIASWGPPWFHPKGGHLFSFFPWCHVLVPERLLCWYRGKYYRKDGARRFREVEGGLNQMTIQRFERMIADSRMRVLELELVPIRSVAALHNQITREFFTSIVRCRLAVP
jgi:SAM-dependent methyltransferase